MEVRNQIKYNVLEISRTEKYLPTAGPYESIYSFIYLSTKSLQYKGPLIL